jgi:hypothetical protein
MLMAMTGGPEGVFIEFSEVVERHTAGLTLDRAAQEIVERLLLSASLEIQLAAEEEQLERLEAAVTALEPVAAQLAGEVRDRGLTWVSGDLLAELLRPFCPLPPFCYGDEEAEPLGLSAPAGTVATP